MNPRPNHFSSTTLTLGGFSKKPPFSFRLFLMRNQIAVARRSESIFAIQFFVHFDFIVRLG